MSEIKLKPCPFCGGKAWTFQIPEDNEYETKLHECIWRTSGRWLVGCNTQHCMLNINNMPETFSSEKEAAEAWNMRAELQPTQPERLTDDDFETIRKEKLSERKSGEWIIADTQNEEDEQNGNYRYICSRCGYSDIHSKAVRVPYCWHCGAKMKEASE